MFGKKLNRYIVATHCFSISVIIKKQHRLHTSIFNAPVRDTRWHSWLRHCATSRKVAGSIPDGVIGIFH